MVRSKLHLVNGEDIEVLESPTYIRLCKEKFTTLSKARYYYVNDGHDPLTGKPSHYWKEHEDTPEDIDVNLDNILWIERLERKTNE